ncbi:NEDD4-binding protein 2-like isoform X3 [Bacillus rossius redtenbacheri]
MATRLSRAKLAEAFPEVEQGALAEVLRAHDYSFSETCEVLQASVAGGREDRVLHVFSPEALERHERRLLRQVQLEGAKALELEEAPKALDDDCDKDQALRDANHYRAEAARHAQLRLECDLKAREAYRSKMYSVASYYSQVAGLHRRHADDANARAASLLLARHSRSPATTLDLHFLQVPEALQVLQLFLDAHVARLREEGRPRRALYVVTGRGAHSAGGRARLRPAVLRRLRDQGLRFEQNDNPGLLTVHVMQTTPLSSET